MPLFCAEFLPRDARGRCSLLLLLAAALPGLCNAGQPGDSLIDRPQQTGQTPVNLAPPAIRQPDNADRAQAIARASELINNIRQKLDDCGDRGMLALAQERPANAPVPQVPARPPLQWNAQLASAAEQHARAMVDQRFFDHVDPAGNTVGSRVSRTGYRWRQVGENLAAGHDSIEEAVQGWLLSDGHCQVMIDGTYTEFGLARVRSRDPLDSYGVYWALVVAKPR